MLATANKGKTREILGKKKKMQKNGSEGQKLARKKSPAVCVACKAIYGPAPGLKGRTFELWSVNRSVSISASAVPHCRFLM